MVRKRKGKRSYIVLSSIYAIDPLPRHLLLFLIVSMVTSHILMLWSVENISILCLWYFISNCPFLGEKTKVRNKSGNFKSIQILKERCTIWRDQLQILSSYSSSLLLPSKEARSCVTEVDFRKALGSGNWDT